MSLNCAWICFHKNVKRYNPNWIEDYVNSYYYQTMKIPVYEVNYGNTKDRLFRESVFFKRDFPTHAHAHNFILDEVFKDGFHYAFNSNIDDIYTKHRVEVQYEAIVRTKADIISCNHTIIDENNMENINAKDIQFSAWSIGVEFRKTPPHNIISHPGVVYSKNFWEKCPKLNPDEIPKDDMSLWAWGYANGFQFHIVPHTLLWYRVHEGSVAAPRRKQNA